MIPDHANPANPPRPMPGPDLLPGLKKKRTCNLHDDCDAPTRGKGVQCCYSDDCEDCFPK